jgi:hypothetical protein
MVQTRCEAHELREFSETLAARRALLEINVSGRRREGSFESACFPFKVCQLRRGHELDVQLTTAFREMGRQGAKIAVVGGKGTVELSHETAYGEGLVYQDNVPACFRQIQSSPDAAHAPADYEHLIAGVGSFHLHLHPDFLSKVCD